MNGIAIKRVGEQSARLPDQADSDGKLIQLWLHSKSKNIAHDLESTSEKVFNLLTIAAKPVG